MKLILLASMVFFHLLDDYKLQGILASFKQKQWWKENASDSLYKHDYIVALIEHAFSWTCMIHIPILAYCILTKSCPPAWWCIDAFVLNWAVHAVVDDLKANRHKINLIQDQLIHIAQIVITWSLYMFMLTR